MENMINEFIDNLNTDIDQIEIWIEWLEDIRNDEKYIGLLQTMEKEIDLKKEYLKKLKK